MADRHPSLGALGVALAVVAGLLVGCSDGGGRAEPPVTDPAPGADASGSRPSPVDGPCAALASTLLRPVDAPVTADISSTFPAAVTDAAAVLAEDGPAEVAADARLWLELAAIEAEGVPAGMTDAELNALVGLAYQAIERVHAWAVGTCAADHVVWACPETTVHPLQPIDTGWDGELAPPVGEPGETSPEAVIEVEAEVPEPPVEISRGADRVVVAWLDDDGRALEAMTVVEQDGWRLQVFELCSPIDWSGTSVDD